MQGKRLLSIVLALAFVLALLPTIARADPIRGDANGDGKVNAADALVIEQVYANPYLEKDIPGLTLESGDANGDGHFSLADATTIKAYLTDPETYLIVGRPPLPDDGKADGDSGDFTLDLGGTKRVQVGTTFTVDVTFKLGDKSVPVVAADIQFVIDDALTVEKYDFSNSILGHDKNGYGSNWISPKKDLIVATDRGHADPVPSAVDGSNLFTIVMNVPEGTPTGTYTVDIADRCQVFKSNLGEYYSVSVAPLTVVVQDLSAISTDPSVLKTDCNTANAQTVWYAGRDWCVIGYDGEGVASTTGTATLLATGNVGYTRFNEDEPYNQYAGSNLQQAVDHFFDSDFSACEQAAVMPRDLVSGSFNEADTDCVAGEAVPGAPLWPLSIKEAYALDYTIRRLAPDDRNWKIDYWWLRSPDYGTSVASVEGDGDVNDMGSSKWSEFGVRPAFHLDLSSILFASPAEGGKAGATGELTAVGKATGTAWKLTLPDDSRDDFAATCFYRDGDVLKIRYSGAKTGENEFVSAVIKNANGKITYYGRLGEAQEGESTVSVNVAGKLGDGDKLYVFSEQANGNNKTDYAGKLVEVVPPAVPSALATDPSMLGANANTADAETVWYAGRAWRVIGYGGEGVASTTGTATLLSAKSVGYSAFDSGNRCSSAYAGSTLQATIGNYFSTAFSDAEQAAVAPRDLLAGPIGAEDHDLILDTPVEDAPLWPLSLIESYALDGTLRALDPAHPNWATGFWWVRSPYNSTSSMPTITGDGVVFLTGYYVTYDQIGVRPAFHLDLSSILFASPATGGKQNTWGKLEPVGDYDGHAWKLTLQDESRSDFTASLDVRYSDSYVIAYNGAKTGENEFISAVIKNAEGVVTYYGRFGEAKEGENTLRIYFADKMQDGDKLYVFNEQANGDNKTDYASALQWINPADPEDTADSHRPHKQPDEDGSHHRGWIGIRSLSEIKRTGSYYLLQDIDTDVYDDAFRLPCGTFNLCLNGHTIKNERDQSEAILMIGSGTTLILHDVMGNSGTIGHTAPNGQNARGIRLDGGTLIMNGGTISGNTAFFGGAGVMVEDDSTFIMNGGVIENNEAQSMGYGGGVYVRGTFIMNGGIIRNNKAGDDGYSHNGGGVSVTGTFIMNGGTISGNIAGGSQSDDVAMNGSFKRTGGTVGTVHRNTYSAIITPEPNGGEGLMYPQYVRKGRDDTLLANAYTREGYQFTGWNTEPDGTGTAFADEGAISFEEDVTLYAQWTEEPSEEPSEPSLPSDPVLYGDANGDGSVDMKDVLLTRKFIAKMNVQIDEAAADVNRDGSVDMKDVLLMRKFIAKLIGAF